MKRRTSQRGLALLGLGTLVATGLAVTTAAPALASTDGPAAYEVDCASGSAITGTTGWVVGLSINTNVNSVVPGATFGATGVAALTAPGYFIAGAVGGVRRRSDRGFRSRWPA